MNLLEERYQFYHRQQKNHESVEEFASEIKRLAASCLFLEQSIVRDRVLFGLKNKKLLLRIVQFGGDPTINDVINLYSVLTNENTEHEKPPGSERRSGRIKSKPNEIDVQQWEVLADIQNGFDDLHCDFEDIAVKDESEIDIDNIHICNKLEVLLTDIKDELTATQKLSADIKLESSDTSADINDLGDVSTASIRPLPKLKTPAKKSNVQPIPSAKKRGRTKTVNNTEIKICPICNAKFKWQSKYDYHIQNHRKCPVCAKDFLSQFYLDKHMYVHTNEKPVNCSKCSRSFKNDYHLKKHLEGTHAIFDNVTCPICGKVCRRKWSLKAHMEGQHPEAVPNLVVRQFECYVCHKPHKSEATLRTHLYTHVRKRNILCPQCGKSFYTEHNLRIHLMRDDHNIGNENNKPFKCKYCNNTYSSRQNLDSHERTHTGEKPFTCNICGKTFGQHGTLWAHRLIHNQEKRKQCQICDYKCQTAGNMQKHMKVHIGR